MTTRRTFIKGLASLAPALSLTDLWAAEKNASQQALVIGNGAYDRMALPNPANDAKAMSELLSHAGFAVDAQFNASRSNMMGAMDRFAKTIKQSQTKLVVFYYAGHGVQLDWRNYLVPVDAIVDKRADIASRCIDLNNLLGQLSEIKDKTFIIILDACRDDPFGRSYRPENKGLSQFDAPVGSLLAYATSPGKVASDGSGSHGLYTENLVRELASQNTRVEDALKRVRLNVRLSSHGEQIPWETTSLESDVYLFGNATRKQSTGDIERSIEVEATDWERVKDSRVANDWIAYLRKYPNGRFSEVGQERLNRILAQQERASNANNSASGARLSKKSSTEATGPDGALRLGPGLAVPTLWIPSKNPYSAGRYPLGRKFTVGDQIKTRVADLFTDVETAMRVSTVTKVDLDNDLVEMNGGKITLDLMGNIISRQGARFKTPLVFAPSEYQVGKKWSAANERTENGKTSVVAFDLHIVGVEKVRVPAGEFDTFRVEGNGWNDTRHILLKETLWCIPGINFAVKRERMARKSTGTIVSSERWEMVTLYQQETLSEVS